MIRIFNNLFKHRHKWQDRGWNRWALPTYRACLKCGTRQKRVNKPFEPDRWEKCEPKAYLEQDFDGPRIERRKFTVDNLKDKELK